MYLQNSLGLVQCYLYIHRGLAHGSHPSRSKTMASGPQGRVPILTGPFLRASLSTPERIPQKSIHIIDLGNQRKHNNLSPPLHDTNKNVFHSCWFMHGHSTESRLADKPRKRRLGHPNNSHARQQRWSPSRPEPREPNPHRILEPECAGHRCPFRVNRWPW